MADCEKYIAMISSQIDGELSPQEEAELCAHLKDCPSCQKVKEAFDAISVAVNEELISPPETLVTGVMDKINAKKSAGPKRFSVIGRFAAIAACAALIIFSASRSMPFMGSFSSGSGRNAQPENAAVIADGGYRAYDELSGVTADNDETQPAPQSADKQVTPENSADSPQDGRSHEETGVAVPFSLSSHPLRNLTDELLAEDISAELDELFAASTVSLYDDMPSVSDISQGAVWPFFTFTDNSSAVSLRSFLGQALPSEEEVSELPDGSPLMTIRFTGGEEDCFLTVWTDGDSVTCLLSHSSDNIIFITDGSAEILDTFIRELKLLSVSGVG